MSTTTSTPSSAERNGIAWGARARDWSGTEGQQVPTYEEAIRRAGIGAGDTVLDVGCGTGAFLRVAADHGATVCGLDASAALLEIARERVPEADLVQGDLAAPALRRRQLRRRLRLQRVLLRRRHGRGPARGGPRRQARRARRDPGVGPPRGLRPPPHEGRLARFAPPRPPGRLDPTTLWQPGVLEALATEAGLVPERAFDLQWAYEYADEAELTRGMMSAGGFGAIVGAERQDAARAAIVEALAVCRTPDGGYRLENEWHYLIARAGASRPSRTRRRRACGR